MMRSTSTGSSLVGLVRRARRVPRELLARSLEWDAAVTRWDVYPTRIPGSAARLPTLSPGPGAGEVPRGEDPAELGAVLAAMSMEGLLRWAYGTASERDLRKVLAWRASVFLAGVRTHH